MDIAAIGSTADFSPSLPAISKGMGNAEAKRVAREFEAVMLSQSFGEMFKGIDAPAVGGGGSAEKMWQSLFVDEMAKSVSKSNSVGIADQIYKEITK